MSDAERLREVSYDAALILAALVGTPRDDMPGEGSIHEFDPSKRDHVIVDREQVPEILWRSAVMALDLLSIGVGFTDPDAPASGSFEADVEALLRKGRST